ncbi:uncharacterized protein LOC123660625 [Melitaea cinxia]|uniref:uncharacterized protein LOC123660625 n=1 Tax=Melitaea cinxia TaxID=113334 RepID=UPI001E26F732|nr:uncharacterized protein LOC123660625 [Melitaea cinxia]
MVINVGINGFGRIGRITFRKCFQNNDLQVSAINDPAVDIDYICYLIKFDSTHGRFKNDARFTANEIIIDGNKIQVFHEKIPSNIPWQAAGVQYVVEASGMFANLEKASGHLASDSVKRVIVTAPSIDIPMMIIGVNEDTISTEQKVISCASSTLYCLAPLIKVLEDNYGVVEGFITSIHAMTPSLKPLDGLCLRGKHWRDHRSIHQNIIPATTGACKALGKIIPQVKDKMIGLAFRVPIVNVSVLDVTIRLNQNTTIDEIIKQIEKESQSTMKNIIKTSSDEAVSSDFLGDINSCILDENSSLQLTPNFFKLICWYENEFSYACRVVDTIMYSEKCYHLKFISKVRNDLFLSNKLFQELNLSVGSVHNNNMLVKSNYKIQKRTNALLSPLRDDDFKTKFSKQKQLKTKQALLHSNRVDEKEKNEIFEIWNDDVSVYKPRVKEIEPFYHSCLAFTGPNNRTSFSRSHESVDKDIAKCKMIYKADNLLQGQNHSKYDDEYVENQMNIENGVKQKLNIICKNSSMCGDCVPFENKRYEQGLQRNSTEKDKSCLRVTLSDIIFQEIDLKSQNEMINNRCYSEKISVNHIQTLIPVSENDGAENLENLPNYHTMLAEDDSKDDQNIVRLNNGPDYDKNCTIEIGIKPFEPCTRNYNEINLEYKASDFESNTNSTDIGSIPSKEDLQNKVLKNIINKLSLGISLNKTGSENLRAINTDTTISNYDRGGIVPDIFDKLDSESGTDSENSFEIKERKSQVLSIADLKTSVENLARLDKICKIIEISDELSDKLFSALDSNNQDFEKKNWSFKDLCERLKLDEFCNSTFGQLNF